MLTLLGERHSEVVHGLDAIRLQLQGTLPMSDGFVDSADIAQTKSVSGNAVNSTNFREDLNTDGFHDSADIGLVKSKSGTTLPTLP